MKKQSILKRKSKINGQVLVDIKELPKRDSKISFAESVNNLQLKLISKNMNTDNQNKMESPNENTTLNNKRYSSPNFNVLNNGQNINNNNLIKNYSNNNIINQDNNEDKDKYIKNFLKRRSMRMSLGNIHKENFPFKKSNQGQLETINEIVMGDNIEEIITNNPKHKFKFKSENEENPKKKINIINELRDFDRKQQIKMEQYIDKKRKKQIELMYKNYKFSKIVNEDNNKEDNENNSINNGVINKENEEINNTEKIYKTEEKRKRENEKDDNINNDDNNDDINKDDFQKIKEKYFSKYLFMTKFPKTEYKTKYLDNYIKNDSLSRNLFANYIDEKVSSSRPNNNQSNNIYKTPSNLNKRINNTQNNNSILKKNNKALSSSKNKISNETDTTNTILDSNTKYNNIEPTSNSNTYIMTSHRIFTKDKSNYDIDSAYQKIINSIDDKLNDTKYKNRILSYDSEDRIYSYSSGKIKTFTNNKLYKNSFRDRALCKNFRNNSYKDICEKYDRYNGLKMICKLKTNTNNNHVYNNDYKFIKIIKELNRFNKYYK